MRSHVLHLLIYSTLVAMFFALLVRSTRRERLRMFGIAWISMVGGAIVLGWLMFALPR